MMHRKTCIAIIAVALVVEICVGDLTEQGKNDTQARNGRKNEEAYSSIDTYTAKKDSSKVIYTPKDEYDDESDGFLPAEPRGSFTKTEFIPPSSFEQYTSSDYYKPSQQKYYKKNLQKSGTNVNWNVWKGEVPEMPMPPATMPPAHMPPTMSKKTPMIAPEIEEYWLPPASSWKGGDSWSPHQMASMMMIMQEMKPKKSFLEKLGKDPMALLLAIILPISMMLAAILPTLMNMMMNGGIPTVTTTATGNKGRGLEGVEFMSPIVKAITTFGTKALDNPACMQRIFCQVTKGSADSHTDTRNLQKTLYKASKLVDQTLLDKFGVKTLFESMSDGDCEKIPCAAFDTTETNNETKGKN